MELQIRIAQLQADVQIYLTLCFGSAAIVAAFIIGFMQIFYTLPPEQDFVRQEIFVITTVLSAVLIWLSSHYVRKARAAREKMKELKKEYCWRMMKKGCSIDDICAI